MNTLKPFISVTVPAFKAKFLVRCVESILSQSYQNFEIIIVDDNSPEDILSVINTFEDDRIKYFHNETGFGGYNVVHNWNRCLSLSNGEYIICMGDDDMLKPGCLSNYVAEIKKNPDVKVFHTRTEIINENDEIIDLQEPRPYKESVYSMIWNLWKGRDQFIGDFLFNVKALKDSGGFFFLPYAWSSDKITAYELALSGGVINIDNIGFSYRRSNITISNSCNNQRDRYCALMGEREWYKRLLTYAKPEAEIDLLYFDLIKKGYKKYCAKKLDEMLTWDLNDSPSHLFYWIGKRNEYGYSAMYCIRMFKLSLHAVISKLFRLIFHHY